MINNIKNKFNLIFILFFFNNSITLCSSSSSSLPSSNGDNNWLILACVIISIFVTSCLLLVHNKNTTNNNSPINLDNIDLNVSTNETLPKLKLDLKNEMLVLKDPIDSGVPNPILIAVTFGILVGMCVYSIYNLLQDYGLLKKNKIKK
jgi:hypothetical protein